MTDPIQVGRIEQLTFTEKDRNREFVVVEKTGKQVAAQQWLESQIAQERKVADGPFRITTLKYDTDGSLSLDEVDEWLRDSETNFSQIGSEIIHLVRAGSDSQAMLILDRYGEFIERRQFQIDCESECTACGKPEKYHPAVWDVEDETYKHETIVGGKKETCDAVLLFFGFEDRNK
jgi:hypothetical protein